VSTKTQTPAKLVESFITKVRALEARRDSGEFKDAKAFTRAVSLVEESITPDLVYALRSEASAGESIMLQREAAALIFKSEKSWNSWERGGRTPSLGDLSHFMLASGILTNQ
jgi:hypothetical protein|tara:strand:+ start:752 stop:1087 length:336 start_codon:yes stop_codon:yes gene_type:complete